MSPKHPKIVTSPHYHLWSDALHGRALARQANNRWDRGTYVRWTVITAWTTLEMACEHALGVPEIGRRFRKNLDAAVASAGFQPLDWGSGIWQEVLRIHAARKDFVHLNVSQAQLFAEIDLAELAIDNIRRAIAAIYTHAGNNPPTWLADDNDPGWDAPVTGLQAHLAAVRAGTSDPEHVIRIAYIYKDKEFESEILPETADVEATIQSLLENLNIPISGIRIYHGARLVDDRSLAMRGAQDGMRFNGLGNLLS